MKQEFLKDKAGVIRISTFINNVQQVPTSGFIVLKNPSGTEIQASAAVTIDALGEMTYDLTTTHTATLGLNFIAEWTYSIAGQTYYESQLFDIVRSRLSIPITDDDLYNELESLRTTNIQQQGTATSATASTLIDTSELKQPDDYWNGGTIEILSGTGVNQIRDITDFVQADSEITVSPDWVTTPDTTSVYRVVKSYSRAIEQSFVKLCTMIYNKGKRHALILESSQLKVPMIYLTIHFIALDLMDDDNDKWTRVADRYWSLFSNSFDTLKLEYDEDESGTISGVEEEQASISSIRIFRS
jgi:hypothetical protein